MTALLTALILLALLVLARQLFRLIRQHGEDRKEDDRARVLGEHVARLLQTLDLDRADKLMIVAHPDDETIWGGGHLLQDKGRYLVVCITAGTDPVRDEELRKAMAICDAQYLRLGFPDLDANNKQDRWKTIGIDIRATLSNIMTAKTWKTIVTHNPRGEYGHRHHKMTSRFVTSIFKRKIRHGDLYYFGVYYKPRHRKKLDRHHPLPDDIAVIKTEKMLPVYASQSGPRKSYEHMFRYEDWLRHDRWNGFVILLRSRNIIP